MANEFGHCLQNCQKIEAHGRSANFVDDRRAFIPRNCGRRRVRPLSALYCSTRDVDASDSTGCFTVQHNLMGDFFDYAPWGVLSGWGGFDLKTLAARCPTFFFWSPVF